jgi:hypothetical protein
MASVKVHGKLHSRSTADKVSQVSHTILMHYCTSLLQAGTAMAHLRALTCDEGLRQAAVVDLDGHLHKHVTPAHASLTQLLACRCCVTAGRRINEYNSASPVAAAWGSVALSHQDTSLKNLRADTLQCIVLSRLRE